MARVTLAGVSGRYGDVTALEPLDLRVAEGEFLTLLGPSGCGKTTTLRIVAGFLAPSTGRVMFDEEDVTERAPNRRQIGMVFQDYALFPHLTVADNVGFGLRERGVARAPARQRIDELLELVRLSGLGGRYPAQLSGGQRQRVALARALAHPPRVLLMDEPLGALDLKLREAMQTEIHRIQRRIGITTIYVTHDQGEAMALSDRIAVMRAGRIVQLADARTLYLRPRTRFVADFIGKINFLPVTVEGREGDATRASAPIGRFRVREDATRVSGPASLAVRPEHLRLLPPDRPMRDDNQVDGRIAEVRFSGNVVRCDVTLADGAVLVAETAPDDPLAVPGAAIRLGWSADRCTLLDED